MKALVHIITGMINNLHGSTDEMLLKSGYKKNKISANKWQNIIADISTCQ